MKHDDGIRREAAMAMRVLSGRRGSALSRTGWVLLRRALRHLIGASRSTTSRVPDALREPRQPIAPGAASAGPPPTVLILTPVKDAADCLDGYVERIRRLTYPHDAISVGFLEGDSADTTFVDLQRHLPALQAEFRRANLWKKDFGYRIPPGMPRWEPSIQIQRRAVLAKSRNHLLFRALDDEAWVLWLDADVVDFPPDLIEQLLATGKDVVQPHCVIDPGGETFDRNGWRDHGRLHLDDLRSEGELVELHAVGGTVLLVRADAHRDGLIFPAFLYGGASPLIRRNEHRDPDTLRPGEIETEGLGIMAHDLGYRCWGMPHFEVIHRRS